MMIPVNQEQPVVRAAHLYTAQVTASGGFGIAVIGAVFSWAIIFVIIAVIAMGPHFANEYMKEISRWF